MFSISTVNWLERVGFGQGSGFLIFFFNQVLADVNLRSIARVYWNILKKNRRTHHLIFCAQQLILERQRITSKDASQLRHN